MMEKLVKYYKNGLITKQQLITLAENQTPEVQPINNVHPILQHEQQKALIVKHYLQKKNKSINTNSSNTNSSNTNSSNTNSSNTNSSNTNNMPNNDNIKNYIEEQTKIKNLRKMLNDDKTVRKEQATYIGELLKLPFRKRLDKLKQSSIIKEFKSEHNHSDKVYLIDGFVVKKQIEQTSMGNHLFWNEVNALKKLLPYNHFPKIIAYDAYSLVIYMSYCGELVDHKNLPNNWRQQLETIKSYLYEAGVNSNDMILRNTCILDGRVNIIDFGMPSMFKKDVAHSMTNLYNRMMMLESKRGRKYK
jgi:hypothetical protein